MAKIDKGIFIFLLLTGLALSLETAGFAEDELEVGVAAPVNPAFNEPEAYGDQMITPDGSVKDYFFYVKDEYALRRLFDSRGRINSPEDVDLPYPIYGGESAYTDTNFVDWERILGHSEPNEQVAEPGVNSSIDTAGISSLSDNSLLNSGDESSVISKFLPGLTSEMNPESALNSMDTANIPSLSDSTLPSSVEETNLTSQLPPEQTSEKQEELR